MQSKMLGAVIGLTLLIACGLAEPIGLQRPQPKYVDSPVWLQHQKNLIELYYHIHEPPYSHAAQVVGSYYPKDHVTSYSNTTAVKITVNLIKNGWVLPQGVPFSILEPAHRFEVETYFSLLYSAKDFETFYNTAVYLRNHVNEYIFVYVLTVAVYHRQDTQGMVVPRLSEVLPSFFYDSQIMEEAQRIAVHSQYNVEYYPSTYVHNGNNIIRWNASTWPCHSKNRAINYYTNDVGLNEYYYNDHVLYPFWLSKEYSPLMKDRRGERFWFNHKQYLARYYMERLSNGLGEIPVLGMDIVEQGYWSGLSYVNGLQMSVRPNFYYLQQSHLVNEIEKIEEYEDRVMEAIHRGYVENSDGERIPIRNPEAIDILGNIIEANTDSPNNAYYKDFISVFKKLLGDSVVHNVYENEVPLVNPSPLEHYQSSLRDPAFYMIWKRVMRMYTQWHMTLPRYTREELVVPDVAIEHVEVDKLVTYWDHAYTNVSMQLYMTEQERADGGVHESVLVETRRLNHEDFTIKIKVKSHVAKNVNIKFFLAPKYDSAGNEIPLHENSENFFLFDTFIHALSVGENVIVRSNVDNVHPSYDIQSSWVTYQEVMNAINNHGKFAVDPKQRIDYFPKHLILPKGHFGGMPFVVMVYIGEYHAPNVLYGTGYDVASSSGVGSGARRITSDPLGFPLDRALYQYQVHGLQNIWFEDVVIYHKHN
ncbi:hypothetical protein ACJJTC_005915 [Scirpophaga incertulas]